MESSKNEILVILDTNFIISSLKFGICLDNIQDLVHRKHRIVIPTNVVKELKKLELSGKDEMMKRIAIQLSHHYDVLELEGPVDESIIEYSKDNEVVVATNDRDLRRSLREVGAKVMYIRNRRYYAIDGNIV